MNTCVYWKCVYLFRMQNYIFSYSS